MLTFNNKIITYNTKWIGDTYTPPEPIELPPFTLRVKFKTGHNPIPPNTKFDVLTQISVEPNIWDLTRYDPNWRGVLAENLYLLEVLGANTTGVTNMRNMFGYQSYVGDLSSVVLFDTSSVTDMSFMFYGCDKLASIPLYDTSNVTNMNNMFTNCYKLASIPLFDTSNVTSMAVMFDYCTALTSVPLFDTSNVTDMSVMFRGCRLLTSVPLFDTSKVKDMESMLEHCESLTSVPLFNTSNVTSMNTMLGFCSSLTSVPLFNTSKVTNMSWMLRDCVNIQSGALALYRQASSQSTPPSKHSRTFENCGSNTTTGAAELAQIPSDWK